MTERDTRKALRLLGAPACEDCGVLLTDDNRAEREDRDRDDDGFDDDEDLCEDCREANEDYWRAVNKDD